MSEDTKVDGALPLEVILSENIPLREMILSMDVGKKWLFTNAGKMHAERVISILGLEGLFQGTTYCNYLEPRFVCKPDCKSFEKAMREAGVTDAGDCYLIDDSGPNIEMATKIGWNTVHLVDKKDPSPLRQLGHFQVHTPLDLPKVMPQFWK
ncbi:hypothetical protein BGZ93_005871 [Podila epicladia]|nr:hypothetical protein BGZ92_011165 [Podila epicladia]KAG0099797.1 hypothetical protein BGZ93_005871 [Podila epicladia]